MSETAVTEVTEVKAPRVVPALKGAASKTGSALHTTGSVVADANLRKIGKGFKSLGRHLPKVRIERA